MKYYKNKGFTLAEFLVVLAVISIILIASKPIMTVRKNMQNFDIDAVSCLKSEFFEPESEACEQSIEKCRFNSGKACDTIKYVADHGRASEQNTARQVLRGICDQGGEEACKYFVDSCIKDSDSCDLNKSDNDLNFYLLQPAKSKNLGRIKVKKYANTYLLQGLNTLTSEVQAACSAGGDTACIMLAEQCKTNSHWDSCRILLDNCTGGSEMACKQGYMYNMNKSCKTIRDTFNPHKETSAAQISKLEMPASGIFMITPMGWESRSKDISASKKPFRVYCNMELDDDPDDNEPPGGWTLVMKQKKGDGTTLRGDKDIWTASDLKNFSSDYYLDDKVEFMNVDKDKHQNFVSRGFRLVPVEYKLLLAASNESTYWTHDAQGASAQQLFAIPKKMSEPANNLRPDWFIGSSVDPKTRFPDGTTIIRSASKDFNHQQVFRSDVSCGVRWGWTANDMTSNRQRGSHKACGGLGAYGEEYGGRKMGNAEGAWQPADLYLYVK